MDFNPQLFELVPALTEWLKIFGSLVAVGAVIAFIVSFVNYGTKGPLIFIKGLGTSLLEAVAPAPRRVFALATLTFRESVRNKVMLVFVLFAVLFMFAGWFMGSSEGRADLEVAINVTFVFKVVSGLVIFVMLLLSCWGIPVDIKARSLHTVVTKPVTCMEVVLGRFLGYLTVGTIILAIMGGIGYVWILRQTPDSAEKEHLICRVPQYGKLSFLNINGRPAEKGINVGDMWEYRSFIQGASKARAIWTFENISPSDVVEVEEYDEKKKEVVVNKYLQLESQFGVFRTHKGDIKKGVAFNYTLVNNKGTRKKEDDLIVPLRILNSKEFKLQVTNIPLKIEYRQYTKDKKEQIFTADLFEDLVHEGKLQINVACVDSGQNIGMGQSDLFIRTPDKPFWVGYFKAIFSIWMMLAVVVALGVSASTFVKGPVATGTTFAFIVIGSIGYDFLVEMVGKWKTGILEGGGLTESVYRLVTHANPSREIDPGTLISTLRTIDSALFYLLEAMSKIIPNLTNFNAMEWVAKGYDVPWSTSLFHALAMTVGFIVPALLLGFFSLKYRELESK